MAHLSSKVEDLNMQLASQQDEMEKYSDKMIEAEQRANLAKEKAKMNADATTAIQDALRCSKAKNEQLDAKLRETRNQLDDSQISQHKLSSVNDRLGLEVRAMAEKHKSDISSWLKGQNKIIATAKQLHLEETQSQQKLVGNLRQENSSLTRNSAQISRELQSCQQRCSVLEKQLAGVGSEHRNALENILNRATDAEGKLAISQMVETELKKNLSKLEDNLASVQLGMKNKDVEHNNLYDRLKRDLRSMKEENQAMRSKQIPYLEEEVRKVQQRCVKEKQNIQEETERKMRDVQVGCDALRAAMENEKLKSQELEDLLEKEKSSHRSTLDQIVAGKNDIVTQMEQECRREREVGQRLMKKVHDLNGKVQALTTVKLQLNSSLHKHVDQVYSLEKIIASGEVKLSQFGKQLARSMDDQERRIMNEHELKKELNRVRAELERAKRACGS